MIESDLHVNTEVGLILERKSKQPHSDLQPQGFFHVEHFDKHGNLKGKYDLKNGVTNDGRNFALNVLFRSGTAKIDNWYLSLISKEAYAGGPAYSALAAADTHAAHNGWGEFYGYDEATRPAWAPASDATLQTITNATPISFTISTGVNQNVKGVFLSSINTKGSVAAGTLWATALFGSDVPIIAEDVLKVTYTVNALSS